MRFTGTRHEYCRGLMPSATEATSRSHTILPIHLATMDAKGIHLATMDAKGIHLARMDAKGIHLARMDAKSNRPETIHLLYVRLFEELVL